MLTFREIFASTDELKRTGQHDKLIGLLTYIHSYVPDSDTGLQALAELSGLFKDLGQMDKSYHLMKTLAETFEAKKNYRAAADAYASLSCGALYTDGVTLETYHMLTRRVSLYLERAIPKMSHLNHDMQVGRRLKIGILSPDFCMHSLAYLVMQPLVNFTKLTPHELHIYHLRSLNDTVTDQVRNTATSFTHVYGWDDNAIAQKIYDDKIDVLFDISGYTAETRLPVFARHPAPVQIGWISGMMTPTGLDCLPYFFSDKFMRPDKAPVGLCSILEGTSALTYHTLRAQDLEIGPLPAGKNGYITFGSFNNPCKINQRVLAAWAEILRRVPRSKLHLKTYHDIDAVRIRETMTGYGVDTNRLVLMPSLPSSSDVQEYYSKNVDIFLDSWPCSGCLTTAEALWMGVPTVSYYEDVFCSRQTHSILNNIGITNLSSPSIQGYVDAAVGLAMDGNRLGKLRTELRGMIKASPLQDFSRMAKELAKAAETAWESVVTGRKNTLDSLRKAA